MEKSRKQQDAYCNTETDSHKEFPMNFFPIREIEALYSGEKITINAADIGYSSARNTGNEVTDSHDHSYEKESH